MKKSIDSLRISRGVIEFVADSSTDFYNDQISTDKKIFVICGAGGMVALTGKALVDMGYDKASDLGGVSAWEDAGGPTER